jgi:pilus assembly protein CpaC
MNNWVKHACIAAWLLGTAAESRSAETLPDALDMFVGDSRVIGASARRVAVGNGKVLSVSTIGADGLLFLGEGAGTTIVQLWLDDGTRHRMVVRVTEADLESVMQAVRGMIADVPELRARVAGSRVVLESVVSSERAAERATAVAGLYPGVAVSLVGKAGLDRMIHFDVKIVEFRRSKLRELGIRWRDAIAGPTARVAADVASNAALRTRPVQAYFGLTTEIDSRIQLLEEEGDASLVAEPTLSCRSGGAARFVSGGEVAIPIIDKLGGTDVEYKEYGVILDVKPIADANGGIAARVDTEVSQIDASQSVLGVPGFLKRRSATDITLRDGETLVIAGLVNRARGTTESGVPGLRRAPVVGRAFRSRTLRDEATELVIFLTPHVMSAEPASAEGSQALDREIDDRLQRARERIRTGGHAASMAPASAPPRPAERE